jgi:hypothetical protein
VGNSREGYTSEDDDNRQVNTGTECPGVLFTEFTLLGVMGFCIHPRDELFLQGVDLAHQARLQSCRGVPVYYVFPRCLVQLACGLRHQACSLTVVSDFDSLPDLANRTSHLSFDVTVA